MHQETYYHLILRYPGLRGYINNCYLRHQDDALLDFLFALETEEEPPSV